MFFAIARPFRFTESHRRPEGGHTNRRPRLAGRVAELPRDAGRPRAPAGSPRPSRAARGALSRGTGPRHSSVRPTVLPRPWHTSAGAAPPLTGGTAAVARPDHRAGSTHLLGIFRRLAAREG